jgi:hypothetical protein
MARRRFQSLPPPACCAPPPPGARYALLGRQLRLPATFFSLGAGACDESCARIRTIARTPHKNRVPIQDKVNAMASSTRQDMQPPVPEEDIAAANEDTTLNLGHAGLTSECWPGARATRSATRSNVLAASRWPALRLRRPARQHSRHCPRPSYPAEARFTPDDSQFLTE